MRALGRKPIPRRLSPTDDRWRAAPDAASRRDVAWPPRSPTCSRFCPTPACPGLHVPASSSLPRPRSARRCRWPASLLPQRPGRSGSPSPLARHGIASAPGCSTCAPAAHSGPWSRRASRCRLLAVQVVLSVAFPRPAAAASTGAGAEPGSQSAPRCAVSPSHTRSSAAAGTALAVCRGGLTSRYRRPAPRGMASADLVISAHFMIGCCQGQGEMQRCPKPSSLQTSRNG